MKIKPEQIERLAGQLLENFVAKELIVSKAKETDIKSKMVGIISRNFAEEEAIEEEARKTLASHAGELGNMDPYKLFVLTKQRIAAKRGFIL